MSISTTDPGPLRRWLASPSLPFWAATLGCLPLLAVHFQQLWSRPHYRYFPLILVLVPILLHMRRTEPDQAANTPRPLLAGLALLTGLFLAAYSVLKISPLMCCTAWLLTMIAYVTRTPTNIWALWALMCMLLRLPQGRDVWLIQRLHTITTPVSSGILDLMKIDHIQEGNVLLFPDRKLFVEEISSGVVSPFTIIATAAMLGALLRRSLFHTFFLVLASIFWSAFANILRVVTISYCVERMGIDLTTGRPQDFLNLALFCVMLAILLSTDSCLRFFLGPIEIDESSASEPIHENPIVRLWNWLFWPLHERPMGLLRERLTRQNRPSGIVWIVFTLVMSGGFLSLGVLQIWGGIGPFASASGIRQAVDDLSKESFPPEMLGWTLTDFRRETRSSSSEFGERSRQWTYRRGEQVITLSIDYPFQDWHKLDVNYQQTGWRVDAAVPLPDGTTALQHPLTNAEDAGWLIYDMVDQQGGLYQRPHDQGVDPRWKRIFYENAPRWSPPSFYQIQLLYLAPTLERPSDETVTDLQRFFAEFRDVIHQRTAHTAPGVTP
jgi:exosortase